MRRNGVRRQGDAIRLKRAGRSARTQLGPALGAMGIPYGTLEGHVTCSFGPFAHSHQERSSWQVITSCFWPRFMPLHPFASYRLPVFAGALMAKGAIRQEAEAARPIRSVGSEAK